MLAVLIGWLGFSIGFLFGAFWAGRKRTGIRERRTDHGHTAGEPGLYNPTVDLSGTYSLTPARREHIWQRIKDRLAVEQFLNSL